MIHRERAWTWVANYRGQSGQWAQLLHRITGLGILLFLLLHIVDTALVGFGAQVYNTVVQLYHLPGVVVLEVVLAGFVLYHAINGIRVIVIDFWDKGSLYQEQMLWAVVVVFLMLFSPTAYIMLIAVF